MASGRIDGALLDDSIQVKPFHRSEDRSSNDVRALRLVLRLSGIVIGSITIQ